MLTQKHVIIAAITGTESEKVLRTLGSSPPRSARFEPVEPWKIHGTEEVGDIQSGWANGYIVTLLTVKEGQTSRLKGLIPLDNTDTRLVRLVDLEYPPGGRAWGRLPYGGRRAYDQWLSRIETFFIRVSQRGKCQPHPLNHRRVANNLLAVLTRPESAKVSLSYLAKQKG